ncbi:MAG: histidine--tRNA ligase [Puniceicoccales bacterium]|jgi:histidyl-tRNA synthetase|nr:histidine--tRNA ligase [Puniceicoccales bacterium]
MGSFHILPGFRDFYPDDCALRNFIFDHFRRSAQACGFEEYDAPVLEPTELFAAKSGEEIVGQLFSFEDKGGRAVAMRPEMTPSLARMVGERANSMKRPIKWFNISESFRYERPQKGRLRSFYQFNADLFGDNSPEADCEIISLGILILKSFGLAKDDFHVRLSDRKLWALFLRCSGVDDSEIPCALSVIDKIEREVPATIVANLEKIKNVDGERMFGDILAIKNIRSLENLGKFFEKFCAMEREVEDRISEFSKLLARLNAFGLGNFITVDFGIVRGLAYYTGFVFEIFERSGQSRALAGGGRYDSLIKKLGYGDLAAVGFAIGDVTLGNLLKEKGFVPTFPKNIHCFVIYSEQTEAIAMEHIFALREKNINVDHCLRPTNFSKQLKAAAQSGAKYAIIFGDSEVQMECAKVKDMETSEEKIVKIQDFVKKL